MFGKSLFVIGNGFDLCHNLPTSYNDFHLYLKERYPKSSTECVLIPDQIHTPDGDIIYNDDDVVSLLRTLITDAEPAGDKWSDVETSMGSFEYESLLDDYSIDQKDDDYNEWDSVRNNEDNSTSLSGAVIMIRDYFTEWINTIDVTEARKIHFISMLMNNETDYFLSFNYTATLEKLYGVKNICHIHGVQGRPLMVGHGDNSDHTDYYMTNYVGSEYEMQSLHDTLRKDTNKAIEDNLAFFNTLSNEINKIYSFGFSFSDVDLVYISKICNCFNTTNTTWYLNNYDNEVTRDIYVSRIKQCGFNGLFQEYGIV